MQTIITAGNTYPRIVSTPSYMSVIKSKKNATVRFYLNQNKRKGNAFRLYAIVIYDRLKFELSLGVLITPDEWDEIGGQLINKNKHIDTHIMMTNLISQIYQIVIHRQTKGLPVSAKIIKKIIKNQMDLDSQDGAVHLLLQYLKSLIDLLVKNKTEYTPGTVQHYRTLMGHLVEFLRLRRMDDIPLHLIDTAFLKQLDNHLLTWVHPKLNRTMNRNSANKYHSKLRSTLNSAKMDKLISANPYEDFQLKRVTPRSDFLLIQEIIQINGHRFDNKSLELTRDYLLFSLWTGGIRFSDLHELRTFNIYEEDGYYFFHIPSQEKTNNSVHTPLLPGAVAIYKKYQSYQSETGFILPRLSQQKLNQYLKTVGDLAGVQKKMTHKIARHSAATTVYSRNGVPRHLIAAWLGHVTRSRTTDIYAQITKEESFFWITKLNELYNKPEFIPK